MFIPKRVITFLVFIFGLGWFTTSGLLWHHGRTLKDMDNEVSRWRIMAIVNKQRLEDVLYDFNKRSQNYIEVRELEVTAYTPREEETDSDPMVAASMRKVRSGTVAVSRDLFARGWVFGKKVYIDGHGIFEINDLMNERFDAKIDVFMWDLDKALKFGSKKLKVALLEI